ncbi:MAG: hypothetical protein IKL16_00045 [Clostridia bacterium]|nr:hypothetical protein [Clostridia bacterium]
MIKFLSLILSVVISLLGFLNIVPCSELYADVKLNDIAEADYSKDNFSFCYENGKFSVSFDGITMFEDAHAEYKLGEEIFSSTEYENSEILKEQISDSRGAGICISVKMTSNGKPDITQRFAFYDGAKYFLTDIILSDKNNGVSSNYIAPIVIEDGKVQNGNPQWKNFLEVPFDNDSWVEFETKNLYQSGLSHEVGAFFTPDNKDGFIIGSVTHDTWKSAVEYTSGLGKIQAMKVYSGANTELTRDQSPHGTVSGDEVSSATFFVGFYENWKDGMNEYARINTTFTPKRQSVTDNIPIGWNSWGSVQSDISYEKAVAVSDYIKNNFQSTWQDEGETVFVNLDSYWDWLSGDELKSFVRHCEENGQVAGVYSSPFVMWWDEEGMKNYCVAGTDITYNEIRLKKADGTYYGNDIDGCFPLDVTHPATIKHFTNQIEVLMSYGFRYIKLDFLVHGSLEGDYYNDEIQTGIQAYNYAMNEICKIVGDEVFINLSMAPIFPYNYANGRRLCCDTYYGIKETRYMLNSLTYGFWQKELYDYIDPDHIVLVGKDNKATESEAHSRMVSGIITGGSFLTGDNFAEVTEKQSQRYDDLLNNEKLIEIVKKGRPFEPVLKTGSEYASNIFKLVDGEKTYIAVINYSLLPNSFEINLPKEKCFVKNLFTGKSEVKSGEKMTVVLSGSDSIIYEIT